MNLLVIDTETTAKADFKRPFTDPGQPHLVQVGAILCDQDFNVRAEVNLIVKPDGYVIPDDVAAIHGITQAIAEQFGVRRKTAVEALAALIVKADLFVAHSFDFDCLVLNAFAFRSEPLGAASAFQSICKANGFCTMLAMAPICKLPGQYGDYKWPKLQEAHQHAFGVEFDGAHDAMADVRACLRLYRWIQEQKLAMKEK